DSGLGTWDSTWRIYALLVIPAKAGIHWLCSSFRRRPESILLLRKRQSKGIDSPHPCGSPFGPSAPPMFATASAFAVGFCAPLRDAQPRNDESCCRIPAITVLRKRSPQAANARRGAA